MPQHVLSTDPNAGEELSTDPNAGEPILEDVTQPAAAPESRDESMLGVIGRGMSNWWEQVNPFTAVKEVATTVTPVALGGRGPVATGQGILAAQGEEYRKAAQAFEKGDYITGARHGMAYLIPLLGPALSQQSEKGMQGDVAGMVGGTLGIGTGLVAPETLVSGARTVVQAGGRLVPRATRTRVGAALTEAGAGRVRDYLTPTVGPKKYELGREATAVAPAIASEPGMTSVTRTGLWDKVKARLSDAEATLDAAHDAIPADRFYDVTEALAELRRRRQRLSVSGSAGVDINPKTRAGKIQALDEAIQEIEQFGSQRTPFGTATPSANWGNIRSLRQAWDEGGKATYVKGMAPDFEIGNGRAAGYAEAAGVLRDFMAKAEPVGKANAQWRLWHRADELIEALDMVERQRPRRGTKLTGAIVGATTGGLDRAALGALAASAVDWASAKGVTTQIVIGRTLHELGQAIQSGQSQRIRVLVQRLASATGQSARAQTVLGGGERVPAVAETSTP